jgi:hypothetical protein
MTAATRANALHILIAASVMMSLAIRPHNTRAPHRQRGERGRGVERGGDASEQVPAAIVAGATGLRSHPRFRAILRGIRLEDRSCFEPQ